MPLRSLVRPSNVSQVLLDYPRYLHHQEVKLHSFLSTPASEVSGWSEETCRIHRPTFWFLKKRDLRLLLLRLTHARRQNACVYSLVRLFSFFLPHFSAFDANARQRSVGQRLSALRLLRLPSVDERRGGKTDDRSRQTATLG